MIAAPQKVRTSIFIGGKSVKYQSPKSLFISEEDTKEDISKNLVLPLVNYEWIDVAPSKPPLYVKHLKRLILLFFKKTLKRCLH